MKVAVKIDSAMLQKAPELPLYELAAIALRAAGAEEFSLCCAAELFDTVRRPFGERCTRAETLAGDIVIDRAALITLSGARALLKGDAAGVSEGCLPVTDAFSLFQAQKKARRMVVAEYMNKGVRFWSEDVYIDPRAEFGTGCVVLPGTIIKGACVFGDGCTLGPNSVINCCTLGSGVTVNQSQINESTIENDTTVGPFAYVRPNCHIGSGCKIGDFVEVKNSTVGDGTKFSHLTYIGDSDIGKNVNMGCGTVTVNYDGIHKFRTTVKDGAFVGCNTNLVAPVTVGEGAYVAAGATLTENVPAGALAIARARQVVKQGRGRGRTKNG